MVEAACGGKTKSKPSIHSGTVPAVEEEALLMQGRASIRATGAGVAACKTRLSRLECFRAVKRPIRIMKWIQNRTKIGLKRATENHDETSNIMVASN